MADTIDDAFQNILTSVKHTITLNQNDKKELAKSAVDQIRKRTRLGWGVKNGKKVKLEKLTEKYIKTRKKHSSNLDKTKTTPKKSNLTATGQLLKAINYKVVGKGIVLLISGSRRTELTGSIPKLSNNALRDFVEELRPFFELAEFERRKLEREMKKIIKRKFDLKR